MLRISGLLFMVSVSLAIGLAINFSNPRDEAEYVGANACGACHATYSSGLTYQTWDSGPHSKAFETLESEEAISFLREHNLDRQACLSCHSTLGHDGVNEFQEQLNAQGISCERCHGPGSEYISTAVMKDSELMKHAGGSPGSLTDCYGCHAKSPTQSDSACPFQDEPFDAASSWERMGHRREYKEADTSATSGTEGSGE